MFEHEDTCKECMWECIDGTYYGPCEHEECAGLCEPGGPCECPCHSA